MPQLLPAPEVQFIDENGAPYAGGSVEFYIPGTDTPKDTWSDNGGTALNTNPVVLDAAGRALIFGDGDYRAVLKDALGNLIYDQWTSSIVSDAMQPVMAAATIAEARDLLGVTDAIQTETNRAIAAENSLSSTITSNNTTQTNNLNSEISRATAAEAALQTQIGSNTFFSGINMTDSAGHVRVTFPSAYSASPVVVATRYEADFINVTICVETDHTGFDCRASTSGAGAPIGFMWISYGPM